MFEPVLTPERSSEIAFAPPFTYFFHYAGPDQRRQALIRMRHDLALWCAGAAGECVGKKLTNLA